MKHYQPDNSLRNGHGEAQGGMGALRCLESQNDHLTSKPVSSLAWAYSSRSLSAYPCGPGSDARPFSMCSGLNAVFARTERKAAAHAMAAVVFARTCRVRPLSESFATATSALCSIPTVPRSKFTCRTL